MSYYCLYATKNNDSDGVDGQITASHVRYFGQFLHDVVQSGLSVVHLMTEVVQHPAG